MHCEESRERALAAATNMLVYIATELDLLGSPAVRHIHAAIDVLAVEEGQAAPDGSLLVAPASERQRNVH